MHVLSSNVHRCHRNPGFFFCQNTHCSFIFSIDTECNPVDFVDLILTCTSGGRYDLSLSHCPETVVWFIPTSACVSSIDFVPGLSWSTWVCPVRTECGDGSLADCMLLWKCQVCSKTSGHRCRKYIPFSRVWAALSQWLNLEVMQLLGSLES